MTGSVTWEVLAWVIGIVTVAGGAVAYILVLAWRVVSAMRKEREKALGDVDLRIEAVSAKATVIETELREYKQHVGETFATKDGVTTAIGRVETSVAHIGARVDGGFERLSDRIDRLLELRTDPPSARRSRSNGD